MAHKLVTDEMVQRAILLMDDVPLAEHSKMVRSLLEAVADDLIEACALVAEEEADQFRAVQAIRSLKDKP